MKVSNRKIANSSELLLELNHDDIDRTHPFMRISCLCHPSFSYICPVIFRMYLLKLPYSAEEAIILSVYLTPEIKEYQGRNSSSLMRYDDNLSA